jgi:hypothetical protein
VGGSALLASGCSSSSPPSSAASGGTSSTGGLSNTGGAASTGGVATTTGGAISTGGVATTTGGAISTGGAGTAGGGASSTGGVTSTGGAAAGGSAAGGGSKSTGGAPAGGSSGTAGSAGSAGSAGAVACPTMNEEKFSFFIVSKKALVQLSGSPDGFGGDLGGITGADSICQRVAEGVSPCQKNKVWHAFLSTTQVNAIERIGTGPWYDRNGRLFGNTSADILKDRPAGDTFFATDVSTENGVASKNPDGTGMVDNHETLTGSGTDGKVYTQNATAGGMGSATSCGGEGDWSAEKATCWDWTSKEPLGCPRVGHSWPRQGSGVNWMSVWNEGGCAPGGNDTDTGAGGGGLDGTRRVGSAGGYGGFYCFAVIPHP